MSLHPAYETCSWCGGHGLAHTGMGEVRDCPQCGGDCFQRARDARGRFTRRDDRGRFIGRDNEGES